MTTEQAEPTAAARERRSGRATAVIVGILFIIATVLYLIGGAIYEPTLGASNYLENAYPDRLTATVGVLIEFACVLAIPLIGYFLFPVLRAYHEALALAYAGFRSFEAVLLFSIEAKLLSLIDVSQDYLDSGGVEAAGIAAAGEALRNEIDRAFAIYVLVFGVGALILYSLLARSRLVPRAISLWGLAAAAWMLIGLVLVLLEAFGEEPGAGVEALIVTPIAVNEMVLAGWLIVRGRLEPATR